MTNPRDTPDRKDPKPSFFSSVSYAITSIIGRLTASSRTRDQTNISQIEVPVAEEKDVVSNDQRAKFLGSDLIYIVGTPNLSEEYAKRSRDRVFANLELLPREYYSQIYKAPNLNGTQLTNWRYTRENPRYNHHFDSFSRFDREINGLKKLISDYPNNQALQEVCTIVIGLIELKIAETDKFVVEDCNQKGYRHLEDILESPETYFKNLSPNPPCHNLTIL